MPHYAASTDIVALYGVQKLGLVAGLIQQGPDKIPDPGVVDAGLQAADDLIDTYLSAQYDVPIKYVSGSLRRIAIDVAMYTMALGRAQRTEEHRVRYEDALKLLDKMAKGDVGLGLPPQDTDGDGVAETNPNVRRRGRFLDVGRG